MIPSLDEQWKFAFKFWLTAMILAASAWIFLNVLPVIAMVLVAFLITYIILPLVKFLATKKIPYFASTIISFLIIVLIITTFFYLFVPGIVNEMKFLTTYLSTDLIPFFNEMIKSMEQFDTKYNLHISQNIAGFFSSLLEQIPSYVQKALENISSFTVALVSGVGAVVMIIFLLFFMMIYVEKAREQITLIFPVIYHKRIGHIIDVINEKVGAYIRGTLIKSLIVGILTGFALSVVGLPFALMFGFIAGLFNIILYIGPVLAAVPAVLLGFAPNTPHFVLIVLIYIIIQIIDGMVLTPLLLGKAVDLNPLTILIVILAGGQVAGIFGIIASIPLVAIIKVLFYHYYVSNLNPAEETIAEDPKPAE